MRKIRNYNFHRGLGKAFTVAVIFFGLQEILSIAYPLVLKQTTNLIQNDNNTLPTMGTFLTSAAIVLAFLVVMFCVSLFARNRVSVFGAGCRANARDYLYQKMNRVPTNVLYEFGTGKFLSIIATDTTLVKYRNEQYLQAGVYFVVTVLGSCVMIMTLSPIYVLFLLGAVLVEVGILALFYRHVYRRMPSAVNALDKSFTSTRESIAGARDIRILGKLPERTAEAANQNGELVEEVFAIDHAKHSFETINNIVFAVVTFGVVLFAALVLDNSHLAEQLVIVNTIIQYITLVTKATNDIFKNIINPMTRGKVSYERIDEFMNLPEEDTDSGLEQINTDFGSTLVMYRVSHRFWNGRKTVTNLSLELTPGKIIAVCGEAGGGKTTLVKMLLRYVDPTEGVILLNGVNLKEVNKRYYRSQIVSYCPTYPEFVPGTVRQNIKLLNPDVTDEQILATFNEIGATSMATMPAFLDTPISVRSKMPQYMKNIINLVRCLLKPAQFYIFDRSFSQLPNDIVYNTLQKLRHDNKTCLFTTFSAKVCAGSDEVYFSQKDHTFEKGTHAELFANNKDYAAFFMKAEQMEAKQA